MSVDPKIFNKKYYYDICLGSEEFKKSGGLMLHPKVKRMIDGLPITSSMSVLEIGCGRGDTAMYVAKKAKLVTATDYSKDAIAIAKNIKRKYPKNIQKKVVFKVMPASRLSFPDNSFDLILFIDTIEHLNKSEQEKTFKEMRRILKDDGIVFIRTCSNKILLSTTYPVYSYRMNILLTWIDKKMKGVLYDPLPKDPRTKDAKIQHINEADYFQLQRLFQKYSFAGQIKGETGLLKEGGGIRTKFYNFFIGFYPFSQYYPLNIFFASSFLCILRVHKESL